MATYGLDYGSHLVGQGYDGASVMSGVNKCVQQILCECAAYAVYVHCFAHSPNLILVDTCKAIAEASAFFIIRTFVCLYIWITDAQNNELKHEMNYIQVKAARQLQRLNDTRCACRVAVCRNIPDRLDAIIFL